MKLRSLSCEYIFNPFVKNTWRMNIHTFKGLLGHFFAENHFSNEFFKKIRDKLPKVSFFMRYGTLSAFFGLFL